MSIEIEKQHLPGLHPLDLTKNFLISAAE